MKILKNNLIILLIFFIINSCSNNQNTNVDLSSFENLFKSLDKIREKQQISTRNKFFENTLKKNNKNLSKENEYKKNITNLPSNGNNNKIKKNKIKLKKIFKITDFKKQIGASDIKLVKLIGKPSFEIKKGKVKVLQFHLKSCFLDLFFILKNYTYSLDHFEYRSPVISNKLNREKCNAEIENKINSKHHLK